MGKKKNKKKIENKTPLENGYISLAHNLVGQTAIPQINKDDTLVINERYYLVSQNRQLLNQCYIEHGLIQTLVDQPVEDGMRGGYEIISSQLSPENIEEIQAYIEREQINETITRTLQWGRLFGGSGVVVNASQKCDRPLNLSIINENTPLKFYDADQWELNYTGYVDDQNPTYKNTNEIQYNYYGIPLHNSKVLRYDGKKAPSLIRPRLRGWGMSVVERVIRSMNQYVKNNNVLFELLDEAKVDVYKIHEFNNSLNSKRGTEAIQERIQTANMIKSYLNALTMDALDDFEQKQIDLSGLSDVLNQVRIGVAADLKMPMTKLFGLSASGFNAGEDDIENYNSMIESEVRSKARFIIIKVIEIICQKLFGFVPDDLRIKFPPLRILSAEQEENVKTQQFNRILQAYDSQLITEEEAKDALNNQNLIGIKIDSEE